MRHVLTALILIFCILPAVSHAAELNAGLVQGLWFGDQPVLEGKPTRIYVALRNNTEHDLTGNVRFLDGESRIGTTEVKALPGRLIEAWVDWNPSYGDHTITATLVNIKLHPVGGDTETGEADSTLAEDSLFVDRDTDEDGIQNEIDTDDDGDSISDEEEIEAGTDPLIFDEPVVEEPEEETIDEEVAPESENAAPVKTATNDTFREGLEQYVSEGRIDTTLSSVTGVVNSTKETIDTYREKRNEHKAVTPEPEIVEDNYNGELGATDGTGDTATITRTQKEKHPNIFVVIWRSFLDLVDVFYTFGLWVVSWFLGYPGLVQLTLLILILMLIYKLARRIGRRPQT